MKSDTTLILAGRFDVVQYSLLSNWRQNECTYIRIKPDKKKYVLKAELFLKLTKTELFVKFESSSYSMCTKNVWLKTVFKDFPA